MNYKCRYCGFMGIRNDFEIDHAIPVARNLFQNMINPILDLICSGCNRQKSTKTRLEYAAWRLLNPVLANFGPLKK